MVDLDLRFKTFPNLLLFLLLVLVLVFWSYRSLKKKSYFSLTPVILINLLLFIAWGMLIGINHDESEHLHCTWMVSQGLIPFRDFWQHHPPLLWVILAPFFKIIKPSVAIFTISRIFSGLIFTAIAFAGWQVARKALPGKARASMYLLILSSAAVLGEFLWLRPDLFMVLFLLYGLYFSLDITGKRLLPVFLAGVCFALAASFMIKQYLLFLLPVIIIFIERDKRSIFKLLIYFLGLAVGILPTLFYLLGNNILNEFIYWVFKFNRENISMTVFFPVSIGCLGIWGVYLLLRSYRKFKDTKTLILFIAICLSTISSLTGTLGRYYLEFWYVLCAIIGSICNIQAVLKKAPSLLKKSLILGGFFSLLTGANFIHARTQVNTSFNNDKKIISRLIEYCSGDKCIAILPYHPIFSYDAARLYSKWQYFFMSESVSVRDDVKSKNITQEIINLRPAVVLCRFFKRDFLLELFQKGFILSGDYKKLAALFKKDYTVKRIGGDTYYIRNDKL